MKTPPEEPARCAWAKKPLDIIYHDDEWGRPLYKPGALFEFICLEGAQAGLSWSTILARREGYRQAFDDFNAEKISRYTQKKITALMAETRIIRNQRKILSVIQNARAYLALEESYPGGFSDFLWQFVGGTPKINRWRKPEQVPVTTPEAEKLAKALKKAGFSFVGSTICYALMQATGMVNDHLLSCFCHPENAGKFRK